MQKVPSPVIDFLLCDVGRRTENVWKIKSKNIWKKGGPLTVSEEVSQAQNKSNVRSCYCKNWKPLNYRLKLKKKNVITVKSLLFVIFEFGSKYLRICYWKLTPTIPLEDRNCCNGSMTWPESVSRPVIDPRITAFQTRNKPRGIAVPITIAVLEVERDIKKQGKKTKSTKESYVYGW